MAALLEVKGLNAGYGQIKIVSDLDLTVGPGEVIALLGANGAGKSTTLLTLAGDLPALGGQARIDGQPATGPLHRRARRGIGFVSEQRSVFMGLTTEENLRVGRGNRDEALRLFPELRNRLNVKAGLLSGGEQQMLSLARALSRHPRLLLADELSLGLAPMATDRLLRAVREAAGRGVGALLVEQHVRRVLGVADRGYVMRRGRVVLSGTAAELTERLGEIESSYLAESIEADGPSSG